MLFSVPATRARVAVLADRPPGPIVRRGRSASAGPMRVRWCRWVKPAAETGRLLAAVQHVC